MALVIFGQGVPLRDPDAASRGLGLGRRDGSLRQGDLCYEALGVLGKRGHGGIFSFGHGSAFFIFGSGCRAPPLAPPGAKLLIGVRDSAKSSFRPS